MDKKDKDQREDLGHEPSRTRDRDFAPVNRGSDARGRTGSGAAETRPDVQPHEGGGVPGDWGVRAQAEQAGGEQGLATGGGTYSTESGSPYGKAARESNADPDAWNAGRSTGVPDESPFGPPGGRAPAEEGMQRQEDAPGGTGTPGVDVGHPDSLPPTEEGVREAERGDDSRER